MQAKVQEEVVLTFTDKTGKVQEEVVEGTLTFTDKTLNNNYNDKITMAIITIV